VPRHGGHVRNRLGDRAGASRSDERLATAKQELLAAGSPRVETLSADLATSEGIDQAILAAVRSFDGFDVLVNNAGSGVVKPIAATTEEEFDQLVGLNLKAPYFLTQAAVRIMRRRGGGQVVQIATGLAYRGLPGWSAYAATKFGLRGFTECVREEVSREGIKVGIVAPGYTHTGFFDDIPAEDGGRSFEGALEPEDVAHAVMAMVEQSERSDIKQILVRNTRSP
jgi:NAD(P)-dependent dehydrogenase (short-subunit alcohol dehydrogenase family)